jgi:hypothetical protein
MEPNSPTLKKAALPVSDAADLAEERIVMQLRVQRALRPLKVPKMVKERRQRPHP